MERAFTDADISSFLKGLVELGGANIVDDSPDKIIRLATSKEPVTLTVDGRNVPLAIYGSRSNEVLIINPFSEGEADSMKHTWFYSSRNIILSLLLTKIMRRLLEVAAENNSRKKGSTETPDMKLVRMIAPHVQDVDEKMLKEFDTISKESSDFFNIYFNKNLKATEVKCLIFTTSQRKAFSSIRVKSWEVFEGIMGEILGTQDLGVLSYRPTSIGFPVFEGFANVLISIYERITDSLKLIDRVVDVTTLKSHLKYLGEYYSKAQWCSSPTPAVNANTNMVPGVAPWGVPQMVPMMNGGLPMAPGGVMYGPGGVPMPTPYQQPGMVPMMVPGMVPAPMNTVPIMGGVVNAYGVPVPPPTAEAPMATSASRNPYVRP